MAFWARAGLEDDVAHRAARLQKALAARAHSILEGRRQSTARTSPPAGSLERLEADVRFCVTCVKAALGAFWDWTRLVYPPARRLANTQLGCSNTVGGVQQERPVAAPGGMVGTVPRALATLLCCTLRRTGQTGATKVRRGAKSRGQEGMVILVVPPGARVPGWQPQTGVG